MKVRIEIRKFIELDAVPISQMIFRSIDDGQSGIYPESRMEEFKKYFVPDKLLGDMESRYVAEVSDRSGRRIPAGTIGLVKHNEYESSGLIVSLFVDPPYQHKGVATKLVHHVEAIASSRRWSDMRVKASFNALEFYLAMGFAEIVENEQRYEWTIRMIKELPTRKS